MAFIPQFTITPLLLSEVEEVAALRQRIQNAMIDLAWIPAPATPKPAGTFTPAKARRLRRRGPMCPRIGRPSEYALLPRILFLADQACIAFSTIPEDAK